MNNPEHLKPDGQADLGRADTSAENLEKDRQSGSGDNADKLSSDSYSSRKAALTKREIMEQLSRDRFPWEE